MSPGGNGRDPNGHGRRTLHSDLQQLGERAREALRGTDRAVGEAIDAAPLMAAAAAAGAGFLLGGGLTPRVRTLLLGAGSRFAARWISEEILDRPRRDAHEGDPQ